MEDFDYKSSQAKALEQLKAGKPLLGKDGAFAPLLENLLNAALEGEMDDHMDEVFISPQKYTSISIQKYTILI